MLHFLMKRLSLLFLIAGAANLSSYAQAPGKFNYQAIARDNAGVIIASRPITVRFSILDIDPDGKSLYTETFSLNTNNLGLFTAAIGGGNIISGNFSNIDWSSSSKFLKTEIDFNDGKGMQPAGVAQLLSVPYALYAQRAGGNDEWTVVGNNITNSNSGNIGIGTTQPLAKLIRYEKSFSVPALLLLCYTSSRTDSLQPV